MPAGLVMALNRAHAYDKASRVLLGGRESDWWMLMLAGRASPWSRRWAVRSRVALPP